MSLLDQCFDTVLDLLGSQVIEIWSSLVVNELPLGIAILVFLVELSNQGSLLFGSERLLRARMLDACHKTVRPCDTCRLPIASRGRFLLASDCFLGRHLSLASGSFLARCLAVGR